MHAEVPGGLLKTILKRGCWSGTSVVGCFGRGGSGGKEVGGKRKRRLKRRKERQRSPWNSDQNEGINSEHIWIASTEYLCNIWKNALEFKGPLLSVQSCPPFSSLLLRPVFLHLQSLPPRHVNTAVVTWGEPSPIL